MVSWAASWAVLETGSGTSTGWISAFWGSANDPSAHLPVTDDARQRAHQVLDAPAQALEMGRLAVGVQRRLRLPFLDEHELGVARTLERAQQVVADAAGLAARRLDHFAQGALHLVLLPDLGEEGGNHMDGVDGGRLWHPLLQETGGSAREYSAQRTGVSRRRWTAFPGRNGVGLPSSQAS